MEPLRLRSREDPRQTDLIRQAWTDCGKIYATESRKPICAIKARHAERTLWQGWLDWRRSAALLGYNRRPASYDGKPALTAANTLDRRFDVAAPDTVWGEPVSAIGPRTMASEITYIKTLEGRVYRAVVVDLFSRRVVGWSMQPRMTTDLALQALLSAVWWRKPK